MGFVPANNTYEVTVEGVQGGQAWANVFGLRWVDDAFVPPALDVATKAFNAWKNHLAPLLSSQMSVQRATARNLETQFNLVAEYVPPSPVAGGRTGETMPANVTILVQKQTGIGGRGSRGRMYLPGVLEVDVVNSTGNLATGVQANFQTALNSFLAELQAPMTAVPYEMVVISTILGKVDRTSALVTKVIALPVSPYVATQRDRLKRGS